MKTSEQRSYFNYFFTLFTAIYLVMTVIILQIISSGVYSTVDDTLQQASSNVSQYVGFKMSMSNGQKPSSKPTYERPDRSLTATTEVLFFDSEGTLLSTAEFETGLENLTLDRDNLGEIVVRETENYWGGQENYRTLTVTVNHPDYPEVAYGLFVVNTNQIDAVNARHIKIIVCVMFVFWFLSIFASVHLARWVSNPIIESYERQKNFVENASHELRTPLAVLQNRLESLFRHPTDTILDQSESIAASLEEVRNMKLLTSNLLNLARRDDGLQPNLEDLDASFFDGIFANYSLIAQEAGKTFIADNQLNRTVKSDPVLLKQLLTILFDNAIKYTDDDGEIKISLTCTEKYIQIKVADNGPGIPDEHKKRIFDRFYRIDKARTRQTGGFGLGLSLAQQLAASLKGTITVEDNVPRGTVFLVKL